MTNEPTFDVAEAHKHFSALCFNLAWELIDKPRRTAEENERMIGLAQAALWHWTQREDCTDKNRSIGYWQVSRAYALAGLADRARTFGRLCLEITPTDQPFFVAYAYEALARAEVTAGNRQQADEYLAEVRRLAEQVTDDDERKLLTDDLATLR